MAQTIRPVADNADMLTEWSVVGGSGSAWDAMDESARDNLTSYIYKNGDSSIPGIFPAVRMNTFNNPVTKTGWVLSSWWALDASGSVTVSVYLYQGDPKTGGTLIDSTTFAVTSTVFSFKTYTLDSTKTPNISNPDDVWIRLNAGGDAVNVRCTQLFMQVADVTVNATHQRKTMGVGL